MIYISNRWNRTALLRQRDFSRSIPTRSSKKLL